MRVTQVDKAKRRIGLSMRPWTEPGEEDKARGGRGGGFGADLGFGEADEAFQMNADELETLSVGDEFTSPFQVALDRAAAVAAKKAAKEKYAQPTL